MRKFNERDCRSVTREKSERDLCQKEGDQQEERGKA